MTTHFITAEIDLQENPADLPKEIEAELEKRVMCSGGQLLKLKKIRQKLRRSP